MDLLVFVVNEMKVSLEGGFFDIGIFEVGCKIVVAQITPDGEPKNPGVSELKAVDKDF